MKAMAPADQALQAFNAHSGNGGEHDAAIQGVKAPKRERSEIPDRGKEKKFEDFIRVMGNRRKGWISGQQNHFGDDGYSDNQDPRDAQCRRENFQHCGRTEKGSVGTVA